MTDDMRAEMLRELLTFNIIPVARPDDVTAYDVVKAAKEEGRSVSRCQAYRWLTNMVAAAGWETELAMVNGYRTRVWRKPAKE